MAKNLAKDLKLLAWIVIIISVITLIVCTQAIYRSLSQSGDLENNLQLSMGENIKLSEYNNDPQKAIALFAIYHELASKGYAFQGSCVGGNQTVTWFMPEADNVLPLLSEYARDGDVQKSKRLVGKLPIIRGGIHLISGSDELGCVLEHWRGFYPEEYKTVYAPNK